MSLTTCLRCLWVAFCRRVTPVIPLLVVGLVLVVADVATAQAGWKTHPDVNGPSIPRGAGGYFSWWKLLLAWLLFLMWVKVTDWVSRDCQDTELPFGTWVPIVFFPFLVGFFVCILTIPVFAIGYPLGLLCFLIPALVYVVKRNSVVELHERVLTPDHFRYLLAERGIGSAEKKAAHEKGAPVTFLPLSGTDDQVNQANLVRARQSVGFLGAKQVISNAMDHRANKIMIDFTADAAATRFQVDGVWHDSDGFEREEGDNILAIFKTLSSVKPEERRARQQGVFRTDYQKNKLTCNFVSQGTKTGERAILTLVGKTDEFKTLEDLGMRDKMVAQLKDLMLQPKGILLFSAMTGNGLSTTLTISLRNTDRLLRDFIAVEDKDKALAEIENVDPIYFEGAKGESPAQKMEGILRKQPDVLVFPELVDTATVHILCNAAAEDQAVFAAIPAKEAVEALLRVLLMKVPAKELAPRVNAVLNQRLVRKLCEACKEAYQPPESLLKKLGIPAGRVSELYRHPEEPEKVCPECYGIGYKGRTAIFELVLLDDMMREVLVKQPKLDMLRKAARKGGNRTLQEEGLLTVIKGITSLPELMRVLKQ